MPFGEWAENNWARFAVGNERIFGVLSSKFRVPAQFSGLPVFWPLPRGSRILSKKRTL